MWRIELHERAAPVDSCDSCGADVYRDDLFVNEHLCDQCAWYAYHAGETGEPPNSQGTGNEDEIVEAAGIEPATKPTNTERPR